jgi:hypothetical protein
MNKTLEGTKEEPLPEEWHGRRVGLIDALLWARQQLRSRHSLWLVTGGETVESFVPFIRGWLANTHSSGGDDAAWQEFLDWFQGRAGEPLPEDWPSTYLRDCQGNHKQAALKLLDAVAEYVERSGPAPEDAARAVGEQTVRDQGQEPPPRGWSGRQVRLLEALLRVRQQLHEGRALSSVTGSDTVHSLFCFTLGWASNTGFNRHEDREWEAFCDWLRDIKKEFPGEGWHVKYLRDCQGDHRKAALKFLDFAAEFMEWEYMGRP